VYVLVCVYLSYCSYVYIFYIYTTQYLYYAVAGSIAHFNWETSIIQRRVRERSRGGNRNIQCAVELYTQVGCVYKFMDRVVCTCSLNEKYNVHGCSGWPCTSIVIAHSMTLAFSHIRIHAHAHSHTHTHTHTHRRTKEQRLVKELDKCKFGSARAGMQCEV
jgi:hypothetical protein